MAKPSKAPLIQEFISNNINKTYSTKDMCVAIGVSLPTLLSFVKIHSTSFELVTYGTYRIVNPSNTLTQTL